MMETPMGAWLTHHHLWPAAQVVQVELDDVGPQDLLPLGHAPAALAQAVATAAARPGQPAVQGGGEDAARRALPREAALDVGAVDWCAGSVVGV